MVDVVDDLSSNISFPCSWWSYDNRKTRLGP